MSLPNQIKLRCNRIKNINRKFIGIESENILQIMCTLGLLLLNANLTLNIHCLPIVDAFCVNIDNKSINN